MLVIRNEQLAALEEDLGRRAVASMVRHAKEFLPEASAALGPKALHALAQSSRRRGGQAAWKEASIYRYFSVCVLLRRDVGADAWAAGILDDAFITDADERVRVFYQEAIQKVRQTARARRAREEFANDR